MSTEAPKPLTKPQARMLRVLADEADAADALVAEKGDSLYAGRRYMAPREVAKALWPDSPGWGKRSHRGSTPAGGAMGATMPMKAATLLWRLCPHYTRQRAGHGACWTITDAGRRALADFERKHP